MVPLPHCQNCGSPVGILKEREMPDRVVEYRCATCGEQIPLLALGTHLEVQCAECAAEPAPLSTTQVVDTTGLLNLVSCGSCGCVIGRYWGMLG